MEHSLVSRGSSAWPLCNTTVQDEISRQAIPLKQESAELHSRADFEANLAITGLGVSGAGHALRAIAEQPQLQDIAGAAATIGIVSSLVFAAHAAYHELRGHNLQSHVDALHNRQNAARATRATL